MLPYAQIFTMMADHKSAILAEGVRQAQMMANGGLPTLDMIKGACAGYARDIAKQWLLPGAIETLQKAVAGYVAQMGPRQDGTDPDAVAWRDAFDEHIMDEIGKEDLTAIGQDFIGEWLTDSEIDNPDTLNRAAQVMTERLVEAAVKNRSPGALLAEIPIVHEDLLPFCVVPTAEQAAAAKIEATPIDEAVARAHVERLAGNYAIKIGAANFDMAAVTEVLKLAFDDEEFLALGSIEAMGGTRADWPYFNAYRKASPSHLSDTLNAAFMASITGQVVDMPKGAPKEKKGRKTKATAGAASPPSVGAPPPPASVAAAPAKTAGEAADLRRVIELMREHGSDGEEALGKVLGVSRGTVNNIVKKGKAWTPTPEVRVAVMDLLNTRIHGLMDAKNVLSG